jgi:transcriptional regulator with XRE-family HTH domain
MASKDRPPLSLRTGQRIQWLRKKHGWTQDELGRRTGLGGARIASIEAIRTIPRKLDDLYKVASALGVDIRMLTDTAESGKAVVAFPH